MGRPGYGLGKSEAFSFAFWPIKGLVKILNEHVVADGERGKEYRWVWFVASELQGKLENLEKALQRLATGN